MKPKISIYVESDFRKLVLKDDKLGRVMDDIYQFGSEIQRRTFVGGRFILATNTESPSQIFWNYKNQQSTERGFRFLKDKQFFVDSFFLEKPQQVETILFVISLCLLVYNLGQRELRNSLKRTCTGVKNNSGKLTNTPTFKINISMLLRNSADKLEQLP